MGNTSVKFIWSSGSPTVQWSKTIYAILEEGIMENIPVKLFYIWTSGSGGDVVYEGCSNMNESCFITFFTYIIQQNGKRFYKGLYVTFKLAPDLKKNTVYLSSYSPLNKGHISILTNSMFCTYTSYIGERIILR